MGGESDAWFDRELAGCCFADERLSKRLRKLVAQIGSATGQSIPLVCQDWANTKAAYRFLANDRVNESDILAGHFQSTRYRTVATDGPVLVLNDATEFTYQRESTERIFWMTMLNRSATDALPTLALTATEIAVLDRLVSDKPQARQKPLTHYLTKIARLGGYLARANDPPPGNTVMWRGMSGLTDIVLRAGIGAEFVGN
jgi:hypothetical protein